MRKSLLSLGLLLAACEPQMNYIDLKEVRGFSPAQKFDATKITLPPELSYCTSHLPHYGGALVPTKFPVEIIVDTTITSKTDGIIILNAAQRWNEGLGEEVFLTTFTEHPGMQNVCNTAWISADDYSLGDPNVGLTSSASCSRDRVLIDVKNNEGDWYTGALVLDIATHELGHVLGLGHEPDVERSVMQPSVGDPDLEISARSKCLVKIAEFLTK